MDKSEREKYLELKYKPTTIGVYQPKYANDMDMCFDLCANEDVLVKPEETVKVPCGLRFEPPEGYGILVFPRSGISLHTKLRLSNCVGVIDEGYRGEVIVLIDNIKPIGYKRHTVPEYTLVDGSKVQNDFKYGFLPEGTYLIKRGDRIAQGMLVERKQCKIVRAKELNTTERGEGGFGSTGTTVVEE